MNKSVTEIVTEQQYIEKVKQIREKRRRAQEILNYRKEDLQFKNRHVLDVMSAKAMQDRVREHDVRNAVMPKKVK
jgi:hypothetical protein